MKVTTARHNGKGRCSDTAFLWPWAPPVWTHHNVSQPLSLAGMLRTGNHTTINVKDMLYSEETKDTQRVKQSRKQLHVKKMKSWIITQAVTHPTHPWQCPACQPLGVGAVAQPPHQGRPREGTPGATSWCSCQTLRWAGLGTGGGEGREDEHWKASLLQHW